MRECSHDNCKKEVFNDGDKCIFHCEKDDWFTVKDREKVWHEKEFVKKFWEEVREKMEVEKSDEFFKHDFSYFIFPKFEEYNPLDNFKKGSKNLNLRNIKIYKSSIDCNFWKKNKYLEFDRRVNFYNAKFLEYADFSRICFIGESDFDNLYFCEGVNFSASIFLQAAKFNWSKLGEAYFRITKFYSRVSFSVSEIKKSIFVGTEFHEVVDFLNTKFLGISIFEKIKFLKDVNFYKSKFSNENQTLFTESKIISKLDFNNIIFPETFLFRKTDLSRVSFIDSNLEKSRFDECEWGKLKYNEDNKKFDKLESRNILWDEYNIKDNRTFWQKFFWGELTEKSLALKLKFLEDFESKTEQDFQRVENLNRQLKKNFDDKKDYQTADDFYIGEMEMRRMALRRHVDKIYVHWNVFKKEFWKLENFINFSRKRFINRFFLWNYKWISNYNSTPSWSVFWLIGIITLFFFLYLIFGFFVDGRIINESISSCKNYIEFNVGTAFHWSFTNSIIPIKFPVEVKCISSSWILTLIYLQKIFSLIVWTLLILSIRRKFKR